MLVPPTAGAHSPYCTQTETFADPDRGSLTMRLWHRDGILFVSPVRTVVPNGSGGMLAVSPRGESMSLFCDTDGANRRCIAYDHPACEVFEPEMGATEWGVLWDRTAVRPHIPNFMKGRAVSCPAPHPCGKPFDSRFAVSPPVP